MKTTGMKYDQDKLPYHLIDRSMLDTLASVLAYGAQKYAAENWRGGIEYSRLLGAAMRHLHAINDCEDFDEESGLPHVGHAMCCLMFLNWMMKTRPDLDDRWKPGAPMAPVAPPQPKSPPKVTEASPHVDFVQLEDSLREVANYNAPSEANQS